LEARLLCWHQANFGIHYLDRQGREKNPRSAKKELGLGSQLIARLSRLITRWCWLPFPDLAVAVVPDARNRIPYLDTR
jgi:hypothetical protein